MRTDRILVALVSGAVLAALPRAASAEDEAPKPSTNFTSLVDVHRWPVGTFFGIGAEGHSKDPVSLFRVPSGYGRTDAPLLRPTLTYDLGNGRILCSITGDGLLKAAGAVRAIGQGNVSDSGQRGAYVSKDYVVGGPWPLQLRTDRGASFFLHESGLVRVDLVRNLFPAFSYRRGGLDVSTVAFAPNLRQSTHLPPSAVIVVLTVRNRGPESEEVVLLPAAVDSPRCRVMSWAADSGWSPCAPELPLALKPQEERALAIGFVLGENAAELDDESEKLALRSPMAWLDETTEFFESATGRLSIPDAPFFPELFTRLYLLVYQTQLCLPTGEYVGSSWGSNFYGKQYPQHDFSWGQDTFRQALALSLLEPELCRKVILHMNTWGLPPKPYGRGTARFPQARQVTHSVANGLAAYALAGLYYQMTGDREFFQAHPEILRSAEERFSDLLESRLGEPYLFPSMYYSDGDARGDFHTGSNLLAWYSFKHMARIASEAYQRPDLANEWSLAAEKVCRDLDRYCVGNDGHGQRFYEGANLDHTRITGHDGEECDTTLAAFWQFCESDDPRLINHARLALSPENPYYQASVDGVQWYDGGAWVGATFPGWCAALAGATTTDEARRHLNRIRTLVDSDGSIWWWPYIDEPGGNRISHDSLQVYRGFNKCAYGAGVFLCQFVDTTLGLRVDVPTHQLVMRPFFPWQQYTWEGCRLGNALFDIHYRQDESRTTARITNRNSNEYECLVELFPPQGCLRPRVTINGTVQAEAMSGRRYGQRTLIVRTSVPPGETIDVVLADDKGPGEDGDES